MGYDSTYKGYIAEMLVLSRGFWVRILNNVRQILPRLTLVAMATKFEPQLGLFNSYLLDNCI